MPKMPGMPRAILFLGLLICSAWRVQAASAMPAGIRHVVVIVLENEDADRAMRQSFLASLQSRGAFLHNSHAITHPSQPNYIALISGSTFGVRGDSPVDLDGTNLADLLDAKKLEWRVYAEHYPGNCYLGKTSGATADGEYVRKHVPFLSFRDIQRNPVRCARIVPAEKLDEDVSAGSLPSFALYIPDDRDNGHDTGVVFADGWLRKRFGPLLLDRRFTEGTLLVVTFDESGLLGGNRIGTLLIGDSVRPGFVSERYYSHYSLLRTIEEIFGTGTLGRRDAAAEPITDVWR